MKKSGGNPQEGKVFLDQIHLYFNGLRHLFDLNYFLFEVYLSDSVQKNRHLLFGRCLMEKSSDCFLLFAGISGINLDALGIGTRHGTAPLGGAFLAGFQVRVGVGVLL